MDRKYEAFKKYDFTNNPSWQLYYDNLEPKPPLNRIEKWKKKWYRNNVDNLFDVNYEPRPEQQ